MTELLPQEEQAGYANVRLPLASDLPNPLDERQYRSLTPLLASPEIAVPSYSLEGATFDPYAQGAREETPGPYPLSGALPVPFASEQQQRRRGWGESLVSTLLYLWGAFLAFFGVAGLCFSMPSIVMGTLILGVGACELVILPFVLLLHRYPHLRLGKRLLAEGLTLLIGIPLLLLAAALDGIAESLAYYALGLVCLLYGVVTMVLAFW
ncbi:hypothetical protein [Thermogemmatispora carboxidivorans]|uniref:hypothetical protein n=1 Tax=Thermogemmatispora carboxidivorans TaxID=1382306 RepID=UPI0012DE2CC7|nr:hypothetical protein [Thermogemmatispora carboxidivorans]